MGFSECSILGIKRIKQEWIPHEIVHEILVNLPVKTLTRFKCVSKSWSTLISSPSFQQDHCLRSEQNPLFLLVRPEEDNIRHEGTSTLHLSTRNIINGSFISNLSVSFPDSFTVSEIQWSSQGLACFSDFYSEHIIICNPSTREVISLPPPTDNQAGTIGLGCAASMKEFKVARFYYVDGTERTYGCEVFTSVTRKWRKPMIPPQYQGSTCSLAAFLHGAVHILSYPPIHGFLLAFDVMSEGYTSISLPGCYQSEVSREDFDRVELLNFGGSLGLNIDFRSSVDLWLLKDYNNGEWVKEFTMDFSHYNSPLPAFALVGLGDGNVLVHTVGKRGTRNYGQFLSRYNPQNGKFTEMVKGRPTATMYIESLLSPQALCNRS